MKICKKCQQEFKSSAVVNGKRVSLTQRNYCLICSPFGEKYGYTIRTQNRLATLAKTNGEQVKTCPICDREFYTKHKNCVCSNCRSWYQRYKNKQIIYEQMGNKCCNCGETNQDTFHLHHIDPTTKSFNLSMCWHLGLRTLEEESKKCIILCANCHAKLHTIYKQKVIDYYKIHTNEYLRQPQKPTIIKSKKIKIKKIPTIKLCCDCSKECSSDAIRCKSCAISYRQKDKCKRPSKEQLIQDQIELKSFVQMGKKYGVSDNAVRKWFRYYKLL